MLVSLLIWLAMIKTEDPQSLRICVQVNSESPVSFCCSALELEALHHYLFCLHKVELGCFGPLGFTVEEDFDYVWMEESEEEEIKEATPGKVAAWQDHRAPKPPELQPLRQDDPIVEVLSEAWSHGPLETLLSWRLKISSMGVIMSYRSSGDFPMILDDFDMFSIFFHFMFWLQAGQEDQSTQVEGLEPSRSFQVHFHGCRTCHFLTAPAPTVPHSKM